MIEKFLVTIERVVNEHCEILVEATSQKDAEEKAMRDYHCQPESQDWYAETMNVEIAFTHIVPERETTSYEDSPMNRKKDRPGYRRGKILKGRKTYE